MRSPGYWETLVSMDIDIFMSKDSLEELNFKDAGCQEYWQPGQYETRIFIKRSIHSDVEDIDVPESSCRYLKTWALEELAIKIHCKTRM